MKVIRRSCWLSEGQPFDGAELRLGTTEGIGVNVGTNDGLGEYDGDSEKSQMLVGVLVSSLQIISVIHSN